MKRRKSRYAILDQEVMPWGEYGGRRISKLSTNYCKHVLKTMPQMNPLLRDLLLLRIEKDDNWVKELQKDAGYYESLAGQYEEEIERYKAQVLSQQQLLDDLGTDAAANEMERYLRLLRRRFAARFHPDAPEGSAEVMSMVNQIFNELETEVRLQTRKT